MGTLKEIGKGVGSAALEGLTGGVGGLVSGAISGIGKLFGIGSRREKKAREAEEREYQRQLEYMGLQAKYNKEQAKYSTELSKEMWDYTNYENQVKHLKAAGLNPALLYGSGSGAGGSASGGGTAAGVGLPSSTGVGMGLQAKQIDLQQRLQEAEISKTLAEAAKISGVDTEEAKSRTAVNKAEEAFKKIQSALADATTQMTKKQIDEINEKIKKYQAETDSILIDNEIKRETKEAVVNSAAQNYINLVYDGVNKYMQGQLTEKQIDYINEQIKWYGYEVTTDRIAADAAKAQAKNTADRITEEVKKWNRELDQKDIEIIQQWVEMGINGLNNLLEQIKNFMPQRTATQILETITKRGKQTVSTTTKK